MSIENFYFLFVGHSIDKNVPSETYRKSLAYRHNIYPKKKFYAHLRLSYLHFINIYSY